MLFYCGDDEFHGKLGKAGSQIIFYARHGAGNGKNIAYNENNQNDQQGHEELAGLFYALFYFLIFWEIFKRCG